MTRSGNRVARLAALSLLLVGALSACAPDYAPGAGAPTRSIDEVEQAARESTFRVRSVGCALGSYGTGSAFALDDTTLITNRHVVEGSRVLQLSSWDGHDREVEVATVGYRDDLAVITTTKPVGAGLHVAGLPSPGQVVYAVGYPEGGPWQMTEGVVHDVVDGEAFGEAGPLVRITAPIKPGNSGGPLLDGSGALVGVVFAVELATGLGLAVSTDRVRSLLTGAEAVSPAPC